LPVGWQQQCVPFMMVTALCVFTVMILIRIITNTALLRVHWCHTHRFLLCKYTWSKVVQQLFRKYYICKQSCTSACEK